MNPSQLKEEISIEMEWLETTIRELSLLRQELQERQPSIREKTAASAFLAQFYTGIENILKRILVFHGEKLPQGDNWHIELFNQFRESNESHVPNLFSQEFSAKLAPYRKFRHVVHHGYGFQLEWTRMQEGVEMIDSVFAEFQEIINEYLLTIHENDD